MTVGQVYVLGAGLAFLAILVTGRRLSRLKRTGNTLLLTAHKVLSLASAALLAVTAYRTSEAGGLGSRDLATVLGAGALFVVTMASGALVSVRAAPPRSARTLHRIASLLTMVAAALALYFLLARE